MRYHTRILPVTWRAKGGWDVPRGDSRAWSRNLASVLYILPTYSFGWTCFSWSICRRLWM